MEEIIDDLMAKGLLKEKIDVESLPVVWGSDLALVGVDKDKLHEYLKCYEDIEFGNNCVTTDSPYSLDNLSNAIRYLMDGYTIPLALIESILLEYGISKEVCYDIYRMQRVMNRQVVVSFDAQNTQSNCMAVRPINLIGQDKVLLEPWKLYILLLEVLITLVTEEEFTNSTARNIASYFRPFFGYNIGKPKEEVKDIIRFYLELYYRYTRM